MSDSSSHISRKLSVIEFFFYGGIRVELHLDAPRGFLTQAIETTISETNTDSNRRVKHMKRGISPEEDGRIWFIPSSEDRERGSKPTPYEDLVFVFDNDRRVPEGEMHMIDKSGNVVGGFTGIGGDTSPFRHPDK